MLNEAVVKVLKSSMCATAGVPRRKRKQTAVRKRTLRLLGCRAGWVRLLWERMWQEGLLRHALPRSTRLPPLQGS